MLEITEMEADLESSYFKNKVVASLKLLFPGGVKPEEYRGMLDSLICLSDAIEESDSKGPDPFYYN